MKYLYKIDKDHNIFTENNIFIIKSMGYNGEYSLQNNPVNFILWISVFGGKRYLFQWLITDFKISLKSL